MSKVIGRVSQNFKRTQFNQNDKYLSFKSPLRNTSESNFFIYSSVKVTIVNRYYLKIRYVMTIFKSIAKTLNKILKNFIDAIIDND